MMKQRGQDLLPSPEIPGFVAQVALNCFQEGIDSLLISSGLGRAACPRSY